MTLVLLLNVGVGTAQAETIQPEHFFDFEYAKKVWSGFSNERLGDYFANECPSGGPDDVWKKTYKRNPQKALVVLRTHPDREKIKRCFDTELTYQTWRPIYRTWRDSLEVYGGEGWNKNKRSILCMSISAQNIFTHKCNDLPDWRLPINVKEDEANMAKGNARWIKR